MKRSSCQISDRTMDSEGSNNEFKNPRLRVFIAHALKSWKEKGKKELFHTYLLEELLEHERNGGRLLMDFLSEGDLLFSRKFDDYVEASDAVKYFKDATEIIENKENLSDDEVCKSLVEVGKDLPSSLKIALNGKAELSSLATSTKQVVVRHLLTQFHPDNLEEIYQWLFEVDYGYQISVHEVSILQIEMFD